MKISTSKVLFLAFLIIYLALSYYFAYFLKIYHNDAISRTAMAFFTTYGRDPHLAAIGFVWQPLLSLLQIPLLLVFRPLGLMMLSGPIVTAFAGAFSVIAVYKIGVLLNREKENKKMVTFISILFGLNPLIILYSTIGTSEMVFIVSLLLTSYYLVKWFYYSKQWHLLLASFFISLSFWARYESIPAFIGCVLLLVIKSLYDKVGFKKLESLILQFVIPYVYSVSFWILINLIIMKDPFYFIHGPYSNSSLTGILRGTQFFEYTYKSLLNSIVYTFNRIIYLAPIVLLSPLLFIIAKEFKKRTKDIILFLFLILPYVLVLIFHVYLLYNGQSFGWLRFYIYSTVIASLAGMYISRQKLIGYFAASLLIAGIFTSGYAISNPNLGKEEYSFTQKVLNNSVVLDYSRTYSDQKEIASFIDQEGGKVLVDSTAGFAIPLFSNNPDKFIVTSDLDYTKIVENYSQFADWIIVNKPYDGIEDQNIIYRYYPNIWDGDAPSVHFYMQIADWKIFKVDKPGPANDVASLPVPPTPTHYTVIEGESLWKIATSQYGKGIEWTQIKTPDNSTVIHPGEILELPTPLKNATVNL